MYRSYKYSLLLLSLSFSFLFSFSQNLVPNPSFELLDTCPYNQGQIYFAPTWYQPVHDGSGNVNTYSSSDYYNACSGLMGVPNNVGGFQYARTGNAYAGIFFYANNATREYLETKLLDTMIAGKKYCVEFYVSLANICTVATDDLHIYFSIDSLLDSSGTLQNIPVTPSFSNLNGNFITDTMNWILVSGEYIAAGGEKFMTIGNFFDNANTDTVGNGTSTYYYIDDISVIDCGWVGLAELSLSSNITIFPNPSIGIFHVNIKNISEYEVIVYTLLGEKIDIIATKSTTGLIIDLNNSDEGAYFLRIKSGSTIFHKKIIIVK